MMNQTLVLCTLFAASTAALGAQSSGRTALYEGTSTPPSDDTIVTTVTVQAKPSAAQHTYSQPVTSARAQEDVRPTSKDPSWNYPDPSADYGYARNTEPALQARIYSSDPDGDIVHPRRLHRGALCEGTVIRVRLMQRLSTATTVKGEPFRSRVASDVLSDGQVAIPAGSEIDGRVVQVSSGHIGGHGTMRLQPDVVILPDGARFQLYADVTGTPGSKTHVRGEGNINPNSRLKRDGIEYGGAVGTGAIAGAVLGGPIGAITGSLVGAGVVTAHLMINHPQATLETGTAILFTLTEPLDLVPSRDGGE